MKVRDLKVGDRIDNYRVGRIYVITAIGGYHGDEVSFDECIGSNRLRRRMMTFTQFERLKFLRREGDRN